MNYQFRPIDRWPWPKTKARRPSRFGTTWSKTVDLLERELGHLQARKVVIQVDVDASQVRLDGMLRADARPRSPGVILSFDSRHGPLSYPCDTFTHWQDNIRAVALSLESLRAVDRYGVTRHAEQYRGWQKLPPPVNGRAEAMTPDAAARVLERMAIGGDPGEADREVQRILTDRDEWERVYREAVKMTHPDRGGDPEQFKRVQAAWEILEKHHGRR